MEPDAEPILKYPLILPFIFCFGLILYCPPLNAQCGSPEITPTVVCENAPLICLQGWCTETTFDPPPSAMIGFCGVNTALHNPQFYEFIALDTEVEFRVRIGSCEGGQNALQGAIIDTCPWTSISEVIECNPGTPEGALMVLDVSGLEPGSSYWLVIDGSAGSTCEYAFEFVNGIYFPPLQGELDPDSTELSSDLVYPGNEVLEMSIGPEIGQAHGYYWITGWDGDTVYSSVPNYVFDIPCDVNPGLYSICAGAYSGCDVSEAEVCASVFVESNPGPVLKGTSEFCPDTFPFYWFDVEITGPGSYSQVFSTSFGCIDSLWNIEAYLSSTASICCDQTLCTPCGQIDIMLSGFPPWNIHLWSDEGEVVYQDVYDTLTSIPVCPPESSEIPYWFYVTDDLQYCHATVEGPDTVTIRSTSPSSVAVIFLEDEICAYADEAVSYHWWDCDSSQILGSGVCIDYPGGPACVCVDITTSLGCVYSLCEFIDGTAEATEKNKIQVYPQPAADGLNVTLPGHWSMPVRWSLSDLTGKPVAKGIWSAAEVHLRTEYNLSTGMYILDCRDQYGKSALVKVMIQ